jgi:hypothetical protein
MYQPTGLRMKHDESRFLVVTGPNMCVSSILLMASISFDSQGRQID